MNEVGPKRHYLEVQKLPDSPTPNSFGEVDDEWVTIANRWAEVEPLSGRELWQAQQAQADVSHKVKIKYLKTLTPKMRFLWGSRVLNIESVTNPGEQHVATDIIAMCKEES